jgi:large subunit ribosomal protein L10
MNTLPTERKKKLIGQLEEALRQHDVAILTNPRGLSTPDLNALRAKLHDVDATYVIAKNTLLGRAASECGIAGLSPMLEQQTALALGNDRAQDVSKALADYVRMNRSPLTVKGGILGGRVITVAQVEQLATLPPRLALRGRLAGTIQAPLSGFVGLLDSALGELVRVLDARQAQLGESA